MAAGREQVARAIAFFEACDDPALLHTALAEIAPQAKRMVGKILRKGDEDAIPAPADLRAARAAASEDEARRTLQEVTDFSLLQALARAIGQRAEALEIVASAELPAGARVVVPEAAEYGGGQRSIEGTVEASGTALRVRLDNGETWEGPATLARLTGGPAGD